MAPQPGIVEAFLAQLGNMTTTVETAVLPSYGTDREVYIYTKWDLKDFSYSNELKEYGFSLRWFETEKQKKNCGKEKKIVNW
jgi:hypothetical protein